MEINPIAHIETDFDTKFGVPRQSGMLCATTGRIVFEPPYRNAEALRGLEDYDYILIVESPDLMNVTPIYDIKPYLSYTDCHPEARGGFTGGRAHGEGEKLRVVIPPRVEALFSPHKLEALREVLSADPRPRYIDAPDRVYGFSFAGHEVKFKVEGDMVVVI